MEKFNSSQKDKSKPDHKSASGNAHLKSCRASGSEYLDDVMHSTLATHSVLSIEIGKHFSDPETSTQYKELLKKALTSVDKLDSIVEPLNSISKSYHKAYQELFHFLKQLGLSKNMTRIIKKDFTEFSSAAHLVTKTPSNSAS